MYWRMTLHFEEEYMFILRLFLLLLEEDLIIHPERIQPLDQANYHHIQELTQGVEYDLDSPLDPKDE